jgi:hypothetical protein
LYFVFRPSLLQAAGEGNVSSLYSSSILTLTSKKSPDLFQKLYVIRIWPESSDTSFMGLSKEATFCVLFSHTVHSTLIEMSVAVVVCMQEMVPSVTVKLAAILLCIQEAQGLNLDPKSAMFPEICS